MILVRKFFHFYSRGIKGKDHELRDSKSSPRQPVLTLKIIRQSGIQKFRTEKENKI